jgi:hypothetical protein
MGLDKLTVLTHTHTECKDLWLPYFDSYQKFFKEVKHIVLINQNSPEINLKQIIYDDNLKHVDRLILGLQSIDSDYVIISLEDMFLYDYVLIEVIEKMINLMKTDGNINFIRLIKSGIVSSNHFFENLFRMDKNDFLMSITPTIWDKKYLLNLLASLKGLTFWELEQNGDFILKKSDVNGFYYYDNEPKRGGHHDSNIYPHICSAIFKGKWNLREYKDELLPIINKYNININERGTF